MSQNQNQNKNKNANLQSAKNAKNDEFYTQYIDIQNEVNAYTSRDPDVFRDKTVLLPCDDPEWSNFTKFFVQNFKHFGLRKLISTSYAINSKIFKTGWQTSLFEQSSPQYNPAITNTRGKIFTLTGDTNNDGKIDINDLQWDYLEGDGDFRSDEVTRLRDEADIIITNPPFSLFREFLEWIEPDKRQFLIVGNQNAITYKNVFPLIKNNKMWLGNGFKGSAGHFISNYTDYATASNHKEGMIRVSGVVWFTNMEHKKRHEPLKLMTIEENKKFSSHKEIKGIGYLHYDNYDAIDVPRVDAIPSDYDGVMGVPISFLDKYCPEQLEIVGVANHGKDNIYDLFEPIINGKKIFKRILIRHKRGATGLTRQAGANGLSTETTTKPH